MSFLDKYMLENVMPSRCYFGLFYLTRWPTKLPHDKKQRQINYSKLAETKARWRMRVFFDMPDNNHGDCVTRAIKYTAVRGENRGAHSHVPQN